MKQSLISVHNYHLTSIAKELERVYGLTQCHIDLCDVIGRHYRINATKDKSIPDDEADSFYKDSFFSNIVLLQPISKIIKNFVFYCLR